jgi:hypothetical protein
VLDGARGATYTRALDIDNHGRIVGDYGTPPPATAGDPGAPQTGLRMPRDATMRP